MAKTPEGPRDASGPNNPGSRWNAAGTHSPSWQRESQKMRQSFTAAAKGTAERSSGAQKSGGDKARLTKDREPRQDDLKKGAREFAAKSPGRSGSSRRPKFAAKSRNGLGLER